MWVMESWFREPLSEVGCGTWNSSIRESPDWSVWVERCFHSDLSIILDVPVSELTRFDTFVWHMEKASVQCQGWATHIHRARWARQGIVDSDGSDLTMGTFSHKCASRQNRKSNRGTMDEAEYNLARNHDAKKLSSFKQSQYRYYVNTLSMFKGVWHLTTMLLDRR